MCRDISGMLGGTIFAFFQVQTVLEHPSRPGSTIGSARCELFENSSAAGLRP